MVKKWESVAGAGVSAILAGFLFGLGALLVEATLQVLFNASWMDMDEFGWQPRVAVALVILGLWLLLVAGVVAFIEDVRR